jgi:hypothetical protein
MKKNEIAIATMTLVKPGDYELHREALLALAATKLPAIVTDGGSGDEFVSFLNSFPTFSVLNGAPGAFAQIKSSLAQAYQLDAPCILYTEPDKQLFFQQRLSEFIAAASGEAGISLPSRTKESWATYPESQRFTELFTNQLCQRLVGKEYDFCYGPLLIQRALIPYLEMLDDDIGWGWRFFLFGLAHRLGYKISGVEMNLPCPLEQQVDSQAELLHRMRQLQQNVRGLNLAMALPEAQLKTS